jgi:hypothetical protein
MKNQITLKEANSDPLIVYRIKKRPLSVIISHIAAYFNSRIVADIYCDGTKVGEVTVLDIIKTDLK